MSRIFLTTDPASLRVSDLGVPLGTLCVCAPKCSAPAGLRAMPWAEFCERPMAHLAGATALVVVGLSRVMTPASRTQHAFEVLFNLTPTIHKVSIDATIFVSDPWRAWFPFGLVGAPYGQYTYSYLAESHYNAFVEGVRDDDPFALATILDRGRGVVRSVRPFRFERPSVHIGRIPKVAHAAYAAEKERAFDEEKNVKAIVRRLAAVAQSHCPTRSIPARGAIFRSPRISVVRTDLAVDEFLTRELEHLVDLTNGVADGFAP